MQLPLHDSRKEKIDKTIAICSTLFCFLNNNNRKKNLKLRHWIKCEGGFCEGKITNQLTHQLAVAVIGERAIGELLSKKNKMEGDTMIKGGRRIRDETN